MEKPTYEELIDYLYEYCNHNMVKPDKIQGLLYKCQLDILTRYFETSRNTYVLKRNGLVERFDDEKLNLSIGQASDAIEEPLTLSDIHNVVTKAMHKLKDKYEKIIPTTDIRSEVLVALDELGFHDVYCKYEEYIQGE